jgi:hypothetical protein
MTEKPDEKKMERKPYRKPEIEEVQLVAEEAVLAGCKTLTGIGGPNSTGVCHPWGTCKEQGS